MDKPDETKDKDAVKAAADAALQNESHTYSPHEQGHRHSPEEKRMLDSALGKKVPDRIEQHTLTRFFKAVGEVFKLALTEIKAKLSREEKPKSPKRR